MNSFPRLWITDESSWPISYLHTWLFNFKFFLSGKLVRLWFVLLVLFHCLGFLLQLFLLWYFRSSLCLTHPYNFSSPFKPDFFFFFPSSISLALFSVSLFVLKLNWHFVNAFFFFKFLILFWPLSALYMSSFPSFISFLRFPNFRCWLVGWFFFFWLYAACGISVPQPGIKPASLASELQSPSHWTPREVPVCCSFIQLLFYYCDLE